MAVAILCSQPPASDLESEGCVCFKGSVSEAPPPCQGWSVRPSQPLCTTPSTHPINALSQPDNNVMMITMNLNESAKGSMIIRVKYRYLHSSAVKLLHEAVTSKGTKKEQ